MREKLRRYRVNLNILYECTSNASLNVQFFICLIFISSNYAIISEYFGYFSIEIVDIELVKIIINIKNNTKAFLSFKIIETLCIDVVYFKIFEVCHD